MKKLCLALAFSALVIAPARVAFGQAAAQGAADADIAAAADKFELSWKYFNHRLRGSSFTYETAIGSGTFTRGAYANRYVANNFYFTPRWNFTKKLSLLVRAAFSVEYTNPGAYNDPITGGTGGSGIRRVDPFDTWFTFSANNLYKEKRTGIVLGAYGRVVAPTSYASRWRGEVLDLTAGFNLRRSFFDRLHLIYDFRTTKFFQTQNAFVVDPDAAVQLGIQCRGGEEFCAARATGQSPNVSIVNTLSASVDITKKLSFSALILVAKTWNHATEIDQFSAEQAVTVGGSDSTWGFLSLDYALNKHFLLSGGIWSYQPFRTADNKGVRFPFFDFRTPNNNYTTLFVDFIARL